MYYYEINQDTIFINKEAILPDLYIYTRGTILKNRPSFSEEEKSIFKKKYLNLL
jgi:hypothetical protein